MVTTRARRPSVKVEKKPGFAAPNDSWPLNMKSWANARRPGF